MKISLAILDIDGVLVGEKDQIPSEKIINSLKLVSEKGIKVVLNTSKPIFALGIREIVEKANLFNLHITFSGALISDISCKKIIEEKNLNFMDLVSILEKLRVNQIFFEGHSKNGYYVERVVTRIFNSLLPIRKKIIGANPIVLDNFSELITSNLLKVMVIVKNKREIKIVEKILMVHKKINFGWSRHPAMASMKLGQITAGGVSKKSAIKKVKKYYKVSSNEILGVGDTILDWDFLEQCSYVSAPKNADWQLKKLIKSKKRGHFYISPTVENDGIIKVFENFGIL